MPITREQALDCLRSNDLIGIGMEADVVRRRLHPEGVVTYAIIETVDCAGDLEAQLAAAERLGATAVRLIGFPSAAQLAQSIAPLRTPLQLIAALAPAASIEDVARLRAAGLTSIESSSLDLHRAAHQAGMRTTVQITFGAGETLEERLDQLDAIAAIQADTAGFAALAPVPFHPPGGRDLDDPTAVEYLKLLAVCRMYLDTIENVQADWTRNGLKVLQMALRFGANDLGAVQAGRPGIATEEEFRRIVRDAGFRPAQRDAAFRMHLLA